MTGSLRPRLTSSAPALGVLVAVLTMAAPGGAQTQSGPSAGDGHWGGPWAISASLAGTRVDREFYRTGTCFSGTPWFGEAGVAVRRNLGVHLGVEGVASFTTLVSDGGDCVVIGAPWPPFYTGTHEGTEVRHGDPDGRFLRTGARLVGRAAREDVEIRLSLGGAVAPAHRAFGPTTGVAAAFGSGASRMLIEWEGWWPGIPLRTTVHEWEEGAVVSVEEWDHLSDRRLNWALRVGVEFHPALIRKR